MPGFIAKKLCPQLRIVKSSFGLYKQTSDRIRQIFSQYDSNFRMLSLDEGILDITSVVAKRMRAEVEKKQLEQISGKEGGNGCSCSGGGREEDRRQQHRRVAEAVVAEIRAAIKAKEEITASAGIGCNPLLAKIASNFEKPDGQAFVEFTQEGVRGVLDPLSTRELPGVGRVTEKILREVFSITTVKELRALSKTGALHDVFPEKTATFLTCVSHGLSGSSSVAMLSWAPSGEDGAVTGPGGVKEAAAESEQAPTLAKKRERKGMSRERTFRATSKRADLEAMLRRLCSKLSDDLASKNGNGVPIATSSSSTTTTTSSFSSSTATMLGYPRLLLVKLKTKGFQMRSLSVKASSVLARGKGVFQTEDEIFFAASRLMDKGLNEAPRGTSYRLLGVGLQQFHGIDHARLKGSMSFSSSSASSSSLSSYSSRPLSSAKTKEEAPPFPSAEAPASEAILTSNAARRRQQEQQDHEFAMRLASEDARREEEDAELARRLAQKEERIARGINKQLSKLGTAKSKKGKAKGTKRKREQRTISQYI